MMYVGDDFVRRIMSSPEPIEADLLRQIQAIPHVVRAASTWFHGWVEIRVLVDGWHWDTWDEAHGLIDTFAREHVERFSVQGHVDVPEDHP